MASMGIFGKPKRSARKKFIVIQDCFTKKILNPENTKGTSSQLTINGQRSNNFVHQEICLPRGTLVEECEKPKKIVEGFNSRDISNDKNITVQSLDNENVSAVVSDNALNSVSNLEASVLLAVEPRLRVRIIEDEELRQSIHELKKNCFVELVSDSADPKAIPEFGLVEAILSQQIPPKAFKETVYKIKLLQSKQDGGEGNNTGKKEKSKKGILVAFNKIRLHLTNNIHSKNTEKDHGDKTNKITDVSPSSKVKTLPASSSQTGIYSTSSPVEPPPPHSPPSHSRQGSLVTALPPSLKAGDRVIWYSDQGSLETGLVKWVGRPSDHGHEWMAGVEFDNPIGNDDDLLKHLFESPPRHGRLVPVVNLAREDHGPARSDVYGRSGRKPDSSLQNITTSIMDTTTKGTATYSQVLVKGNGTNRTSEVPRTVSVNSLTLRELSDDAKLKLYSVGDAHLPAPDRHTLAARKEKDRDTFFGTSQLADFDEFNTFYEDFKETVASSGSSKEKEKNINPVYELSNKRRESTGAVSSHNGRSREGSRQGTPALNGDGPSKLEVNGPVHSATPSELSNVDIPSKSNNQQSVVENHTNNLLELKADEEPPSKEPDFNRSHLDALLKVGVRYHSSTRDLEVGSMVEFKVSGDLPRYGVIRWIGFVKNIPTIELAGIELEDECDSCNDGEIDGKRYFQCPKGKGFFTALANCRKDGRFMESIVADRRQSLAFGTKDCPVVKGDVAPVCVYTKDDLKSVCGKDRGIQGHHNSCYLDATLFAMFTFTGVFDSLINRPTTPMDKKEYDQVQQVLKEEIVNPLRKNFYVRADRVMKLRQLLDQLSSVTGLTTEEKDPEEFLNSLLNQILLAEPYLKLSSGQESYFYQLFVEKNERYDFPNVQQLLNQSFLMSDIKLREIPPCFIIQMPRFGKQYKVYPQIFPSLYLEITDILENSPRQCGSCGVLAECECKQCFNILDTLDSLAFCQRCFEQIHKHRDRADHRPQPIRVPIECTPLMGHSNVPHVTMELFAVVCIETSHYVAFVKCGTGPDAVWCFFDSMADRKGEQHGYNIPEVVACPDLPWWLSEEGYDTARRTEPSQLPEYVKRLFSDAYMCMYQSTDIMMYC